MHIRRGLVISSLLISLGGIRPAEAGFASKLADTHKFRLSYAVGLMSRDLRGWFKGQPDDDRFEEPYEFIRAGYGITNRLRMSLDVFGYRQRSKSTGDMVDYVAAFGGSVQGVVAFLGNDKAIEVTGGYWELHESHIYSRTIEERTAVGRAVSLVIRQDMGKIFGIYSGPIYNHFRKEETIQDPHNQVNSWSSYNDLGLVGGIEARLINHLTFNGEGTYTRDWGLTGEVGWQF